MVSSALVKAFWQAPKDAPMDSRKVTMSWLVKFWAGWGGVLIGGGGWGRGRATAHHMSQACGWVHCGSDS
jgi:hypothetical protein